MFNQIIECVPNFSDGRNPENLQKIMAPFFAEAEVRVLDYSQDADHNRAVVTVLGTYDALLKTVPEAVRIASELIDLRQHEGAHPRMGATDVVPFIPIRNCDMALCDKLANEVAQKISELYQIPTYLYEESAKVSARKNLSNIRKGQFEGFAEKIQQAEWQPDFGPAAIHPSAGVTAVGARMPLVAFNVNLNTHDLQVADAIAKKVRHIGGGLRFVKAMGVDLTDRQQVQVSMNLTNYTKSAIYQAFEMVKMEARRYGVSVVGSELIGLAPLAALAECASYYLQLENFELNQIIESRLLES